MPLTDPGWAESFDGGGSLMDIVVAGMTTEDWRTVLRYFRDRPDTWTPCIDLEAAEHFDPAAVQWGDQILARGDLPGQLVAWFWDDELEVDLDPRLVTEDEHVVALHGFMRELGQLLERDVAMSWEGAREAVEFRYRLTTDAIERTPQG